MQYQQVLRVTLVPLVAQAHTCIYVGDTVSRHLHHAKECSLSKRRNTDKDRMGVVGSPAFVFRSSTQGLNSSEFEEVHAALQSLTTFSTSVQTTAGRNNRKANPQVQ